MRKKYILGIAAGLALVLAVVPAAAGQGKGGSQGADQRQPASQDQRMDQDRMQDRSRLEIPDQDRDRQRKQASMRDVDIYGHELMTGAELEKYRKRMTEMNTVEARERFQIQHEAKMQERAKQQGKDLVPPGQGPIYRGQLMTVQERNEFREQLRAAGSDDERTRLQAQHREKMDQRAHALDLEKEEAE